MVLSRIAWSSSKIGEVVFADTAPTDAQFGLEQAGFDEPLNLARHRGLRAAGPLHEFGDGEVPLRFQVRGTEDLQLGVAAEDRRGPRSCFYSHNALLHALCE
jgi:hypothetical protein